LQQFRRILVLGGARSGKSRRAQELVETSGLDRVFIATAQAHDEEMTARIAAHRAERGPGWVTREAPFDLPQVVESETMPGRAVLVDCLTLWLSNVLLAEQDIDTQVAHLAEAIVKAPSPLVLVSNEVGCGIVPATSLGRRFRDAHGRLNQRVAEVCDAVVLVTAGCPILVKPSPRLDIALA